VLGEGENNDDGSEEQQEEEPRNSQEEDQKDEEDENRGSIPEGAKPFVLEDTMIRKTMVTEKHSSRLYCRLLWIRNGNTGGPKRQHVNHDQVWKTALLINIFHTPTHKLRLLIGLVIQCFVGVRIVPLAREGMQQRLNNGVDTAALHFLLVDC
jgi:hypothetical protein